MSDSSENITSEWEYPSTKRRALDLKELGARISLTKNMAGNIVNLLQTMGADNELPTVKSDRVAWLNHFHMQVAVNNPLWPEDMSFGFVYGAFTNALMYNRVELRGHNIHAFITAFKDWITQSGVEDNLRSEYNRKYPDEAPKQISSDVSESSSRQTPKGMVNLPSDIVLSQLRTYRQIHGDIGKALETVSAAGSYRRKLWETFNYYCEQGEYEGQDISDLKTKKCNQKTQSTDC